MPSVPFEFGGDIVWRPSPDLVEAARLTAFMRAHGLHDYDDLMRRSTTDPAWFWDAVLKDLGVEFFEPYSKVVDISDGIAWPRWCVDARLNIAHNCVDKWARGSSADRTAIVWEGEEGSVASLTYGELSRDVGRFANVLRGLGVRKGDRVALFMPMCPELAVAFFAIAKIGAVILPLFSGYGADAVTTRLRDAGATTIITADGFFRRGRQVDMHVVTTAALDALPAISRVIVVSRMGRQPLPDGRFHDWSGLMAEASTECATERTGAEDPLMLIYTSGTTGTPKGAVHTHCGFPIKAAQDIAHCFDLGSSDRMFWVTDIGWMMGPWELFGMTLLGGSMLLYDGALDYPAADRLWSLAAKHSVTALGVSPTLIRALMAHPEVSPASHDLSSVRILGSTGEPWNPESWRWLFEQVGRSRLPIINYSGGTEVSGGLVAGNVLSPMKPCSFAAPPPGIAADVVDDKGEPVRGEVGELVVRAPWIGMTRGFWNDRARYEQTYWSRFPDVWVHGDWAAIDADGLWYILGRSDDTIKIAGKRLGPAEVESVLASHAGVLESAAIGVPDAVKGQALVCFVVLRQGHTPTADLANALMDLVAHHLGKPMKPHALYFVGDLPKTRNAKVMRRVIRATYLNEPAGDLSSLENPGAVDEVRRATIPDPS